MSIRAYKTIEINHEKKPTFNVTQDQTIFNLLIVPNLNQMNDDCCGTVEIEKHCIEEILKDIESGHTEIEKGDDKTDIIAKIKQMIKDCGSNDYVNYYCY